MWIKEWKRKAHGVAVYLVTAGMLAALLCGLNLSWTALTASVALMVLDFRDAGSSLGKVYTYMDTYMCLNTCIHTYI